MKIKTTAAIVSVIMAATMFTPSTFAQTEECAVLDGNKISGMSQEELDEDSVMGSDIKEEESGLTNASRSGVMLMSTSKNAWKKKSQGVYYNGSGKGTLKGAVAKGVDVSSHQNTINWQKAKADGVEFAIIRLGYGSDYEEQDDSKFAYNVQQCEKYNIPYGFYLYSYANTKSKNESEIKHVKRLLKGTHPTYPVYYDLEDAKTTGKKSNAEIQQYATNYCQQLKKAGYTPGVYASLSWWKKQLNTSKLDSYERWVAQWNTTGCTYSRSWKLWQCVDNYRINGISGKVDLNFAYKKFNCTPAPGESESGSSGSSSEGSSVEKPSTGTGNEGGIQEEVTTGWVSDGGNKYYYNSNGVLQKNKWITVSGKKYYATSTGAVYKSSYKKIGSYYYGFDSAGAMYAGKTAKIKGKSYYFAVNGRAYLCKAKTKTKLVYRTGPGKSYKKKGTYKKKKTVTILRKSGNWWQTTSGYWVHKKYLKVTKKYPY
ncbi:MAG: GH25 family lysozyme [Bacillota bacterium]|nr:GH25 family lysozyme [Bacillota bacterium]